MKRVLTIFFTALLAMNVGAVVDRDGDGSNDDAELRYGSNPDSIQSTPFTDDDQDGCPNQLEFQRDPTANPYPAAAFSGTWGVIIAGHDHIFACSGGYTYADIPVGPDGLMPHVSVEADTGDPTIYIWDGVCTDAIRRLDGNPCAQFQGAAKVGLGNWQVDGYGWRIIPTTELPVSIQIPWIDGQRDEDGDDIPVWDVEECTLTVDSEDYYSITDCQHQLTLGDPDDQDIDNPVFLRSFIDETRLLLNDIDQDGYSNGRELSGGSNIKDPTSTPETDDDADGCINDQEYESYAAMLGSGAYDLVVPWLFDSQKYCDGSSHGPGYDSSSYAGQGWISQSDGEYYVFDPVCLNTHATRQDCQASSSYTFDEATDFNLLGFHSDGWGWRRVVAPDETILAPCPPLASMLKDEDGDSVPVLDTCEYNTQDPRNYEPQGTFEWYGTPIGDVDDQDPNNPVPWDLLAPVTQIVESCNVALPPACDLDSDGYSDASEILRGSNPLHPSSTPETDDDGDGTGNPAEHSHQELSGIGYDDNPTLWTNQAFQCSGAYGFVIQPGTVPFDYGANCHYRGNGGAPDPCAQIENQDYRDRTAYPDYEAPPGWCPSTEFYSPVYVEDPRVWVWDAICTPASTGNYAACKNGNHNADPQQYDGTFLNDGYGWRNIGSIPAILPYTIEGIPYPCNAGTIDHVGTAGFSDQDGDGVPSFDLCHYDLTVTPGGNVDGHDHTNDGGGYGDLDDNDPDTPINLVPEDLLSTLLNSTGTLANETVQDILALLNSTMEDVYQAYDLGVTIMDGLQDDVDEALQNATQLRDWAWNLTLAIAEGAQDDIYGLLDGFEDYGNQTRDAATLVRDEAYNVVRTFDWQNHAPMVECIQLEIAAYQDALQLAATSVANGAPLSELAQVLSPGGYELTTGLYDCIQGPSGPPFQPALIPLFQAVGNLTNALNQDLGFVENGTRDNAEDIAELIGHMAPQIVGIWLDAVEDIFTAYTETSEGIWTAAEGAIINVLDTRFHEIVADFLATQDPGYQPPESTSTQTGTADDRGDIEPDSESDPNARPGQDFYTRETAAGGSLLLLLLILAAITLLRRRR